ncbi:hypothetical protein CGRA01v4_12010 [Colletotrichum graminicola]|uniref:Uncharacterized protein n=1 Tax=Colletotrichum graminicola (strain M1.001 / M2 / FGSC 10212) TaxID=645133 RepID=E3QBL9_COLGM|nr:uncharacterized protein GLRG_03502 [Colletotrichum graminicola M1.001]EFQ28358.1 hypothetical protein GLRG_03502 [Colletotrichum graminicola M1.001]WDK20723.1 hypothetical protein CGRA01v4_12010 [Colletotrichum graminicola]
MDPLELELHTGGSDNPRAPPQPCILDRKRPVARFPETFSSNLGRKASSFFSQEDSASGVDKNYPSPPPIPESKSVLHRKRDIISGLPSPQPLPRNRQLSTVSSVKAMVAKFESVGDALEKSDKMADHEDHHLIPSSPVVDKHKDKASFADDADTSAASPKNCQPSNIGEGKSDNSDVDLEFLKMQDFFKGEPLARCLEDYIPPTYIDKKTKILSPEKDCGKSMEKAAKVELWNKLASLTDTLEAQYPSVKEEREAKHAVISAAAAYLEEALGESPKKLPQVDAAQTSTKASRRAEKKAQKKADKKAQKAAKLDSSIANTLEAASSSMTKQAARDEPSLREKYPEIFAKIDYWRSLPDPDAPADVDGDYTSIADIDSSQSTGQPISQSINQLVSETVVEEAQSIPKQHHNTLSTKTEDDKTIANDSSESDNWSTGSSNGDPFYLNKYLTPSYQAAAKVFLEDFDRKNPTQPITKSIVQQAPPEATEGEESFQFVQRDPKELSDAEETKKDKAIDAAEKKATELNKRPHERVDAAHADGNIAHFVNYKSVRDAIGTNIKKEDIVPGFGQKKQPAPDFDEEAYATRSIASHTLKPAPLRLPSRMKKPVTGNDTTNVKSTTPTQAETPLPPGALLVNTNKYRMVTGDFATLGVGFGKTSNRIASGSSTHSTRGAVNFSWPKAQHADAKNKYEFNDEDDSDYDIDKKSNTVPTKLNTSARNTDSASVHPRIVSAGGRAREMRKDGDAFDNKSTHGHHGSAASITAQSKGSSQKLSYTSAQPNTTSAKGNYEEAQRRSFTADEYQTLIQEDYDAFAKDSPEKKQKRLEDAMAGLKTGSTMGTTEVTSDITHQTVIVPANQQGFTIRLPGATALPPTPATSHAPMTTGEKMAELDDFFSEENDHRYKTTRTQTGSTYSSDYGDGAGTSVQDQVHEQPWNDANYDEEALSYGYAYKQTNYHTLPHSVNPVPLTHEQRHQVLKSYGIPDEQYSAPPTGYPNPPGPDKGSKAPPCPIRAAPVAPTTLSAAGGGGDGADRRVERSSADGGAAVESLRKHRRFRRAATAPPAPAPVSPAPGYDDDWF